MKILMLTPYLPFPPMTGGQTRSYNLIKNLAELGHEITLFSLVKNNKEKQGVEGLKKICKKVRIFERPAKPWTLENILRTGFSSFPFLVIRNWAKGEKKAIEEELKTGNYDLIHAETFYVMPHIPKTNLPIVLVDQTIEYLVYKHFVENFRYPVLKKLLAIDVSKLKFWELAYWKKARKVIAMSEADKEIMLGEDRTLDVDIVPNGVDVQRFSEKIYTRSKDPVILYLGNFTWLQNREAVDILMHEIWPIISKKVPNVKLWIIGKDAEQFFGHLKSPEIRVEEVKDIREAYQGASLLVAPIYGAGGTRYKNFEAFASGLPVITTSVGIGGTDAEDGVDVIVRDDPEQIAQAVIELLQDKVLYKAISENAKKMVAAKYDWDPIAKHLSNIYESLKTN
jgi:glycosyltransferase involved in cell wall biosynthesis